jgi:hypothetical protein
MSTEALHREAAGAAEATSARAWLGWLVQILCLALAAFSLANNAGEFLLDAGLAPHAGALDAQFGRYPEEDRFVRVTSVEPGGAMARAGVAAGDKIRFDRAYDFFRNPGAGEVVSFTLDHAGRTSHHQLATPAQKPVRIAGVVELRLFRDLAMSMGVLIGAFIIWRSRRNATLLLLGMGLVSYGEVTVVPMFLGLTHDFFQFLTGLNGLLLVQPVLFYAFALRFYVDCVGRAKTWEWLAVWTYALLVALASAVTVAFVLYPVAVPVFGDGFNAWYAMTFPGLAGCLAYLTLGWRRSAANVQKRYALLLIATSAIVLAQVADGLMVMNPSWAEQPARYIVSSLLTGVIASGLFAYAILRQKVFDLGFAVNRTLVYGVVSAILLAAFGLIEWAADHFVPIEGREKNAIVDAAVAVGVFLTFHRVRDVVEHGVEGVFFRRWQQAEAALRRFVKEAAFVRRSEALARTSVASLSRFAEDAPAALYLVDDDGQPWRTASSSDFGPATLDMDDPALVALRAEPRPIELSGSGSGLHAELIAPMVNRNEVIGVVLLGPKPKGQSYRPDEIELIGWASRQIGLDLHALKVEQLEADKADLHETVALLRRENATLRSVVPQRA